MIGGHNEMRPPNSANDDTTKNTCVTNLTVDEFVFGRILKTFENSTKSAIGYGGRLFGVYVTVSVPVEITITCRAFCRTRRWSDASRSSSTANARRVDVVGR